MKQAMARKNEGRRETNIKIDECIECIEFPQRRTGEINRAYC